MGMWVPLRGQPPVCMWVPLGGTAPSVGMWVPLGGQPTCGGALGNSPPVGMWVPLGEQPPMGVHLGNSHPPCEQVLLGHRSLVPHSCEPSRQAPPGSHPGCRPLLSQRRARGGGCWGPIGAEPGLVTQGLFPPSGQAQGDKGDHVPKPAWGRRCCRGA